MDYHSPLLKLSHKEVFTDQDHCVGFEKTGGKTVSKGRVKWGVLPHPTLLHPEASKRLLASKRLIAPSFK